MMNNSNDKIYYFLRGKKRMWYKSLKLKVNVFMLLECCLQRKISLGGTYTKMYKM